ncbi:MAG: Fn3-like domain-containing protein [Bacteroidia bacterium]
MKKMKVLFSLLLSVLFAATMGFSQGLELSPVRIDFSLEPGNSQAQTITVRNTSNTKASYTLTAADWYLDEYGNVVRQEKGANRRSCADWISFNPALVELGPNEAKDVTVSLNVPNRDAATKWALVYVTLKKEQTAPRADKDLAMGIEVNQAIGLFITQSPRSNQNAKAKLGEFKDITPAGGKEKRFIVKTENVGDKILDCNMYLVVSDLQNAKEEKMDPIAFKVLPEGTALTELTLPKKLNKGSYLIAAVLDYGPNYPLEGVQMQVDVK